MNKMIMITINEQVQTIIGDAINAGTECAQNCTLIITEGESARKFVNSGLDIVTDCENWGIYSFRGKLLNVCDVFQKQISENKEVQALEQIKKKFFYIELCKSDKYFI